MIAKLERLLKPDVYCLNLDSLELEDYFAKGYRLLLIDVDNTLAFHGADQADDYARRTIKRARDIGYICQIISNAGHKRIGNFASSLDTDYKAMANKPSSKAILRACSEAGVEPGQAIMVGDQILTDVIAAKRAGVLAVLVKPRARSEAPNVRLKRLIERWLFRHFRLNNSAGK